ncbi:unnamed protein product [Prunus brigantina]
MLSNFPLPVVVFLPSTLSSRSFHFHSSFGFSSARRYCGALSVSLPSISSRLI